MASRSAHPPSHAFFYQAGRDRTPERKCLQQARKQGAASCQSAKIPQTARTRLCPSVRAWPHFQLPEPLAGIRKMVWFYPGPASQLEYGRDIFYPGIGPTWITAFLLAARSFGTSIAACSRRLYSTSKSDCAGASSYTRTQDVTASS